MRPPASLGGDGMGRVGSLLACLAPSHAVLGRVRGCPAGALAVLPWGAHYPPKSLVGPPAASTHVHFEVGTAHSVLNQGSRWRGGAGRRGGAAGLDKRPDSPSLLF